METKAILTNEEIEHLARRIINYYWLDYNNAEIELQENELYMFVEAPNHATVGVSVDLTDLVLNDKKMAKKIILKAIAERIRTFSADDEFDEIWSAEFGRHNGFRPSEFIQMLQEDEEYFKEHAVRMYKAAISLDYEEVLEDDK
ncbi:hypothetical protein [Ligilactobacillus salivarius]|uniref:hypothetical protein n=1 Tax=Ligilactobacillus salivarius TaxID=1624 RepID=UPI00296743BB|nr:hypothetical protein [Ligilactobacillus salivarius]MDW3023419.1 hypothetical protein [Ligilactobacillus salivarius]